MILKAEVGKLRFRNKRITHGGVDSLDIIVQYAIKLC